MMNARRFALAALALVGWSTSDLMAQSYTPKSRAPKRASNRYVPSRPTVSPYLNLLRNDASAATNYYTLVRPQLDQQALNYQQQMMINEQSEEIRQLQSQRVESQKLVVRVPQGNGRSGSVYNDRSHFYPQTSTVGKRR